MKVIVFNPEKCIGCRTCELVCSVKHLGVVSPLRSRIRILKNGEYVFVPARCRQCEDPLCLMVCPVKAITRDEELGIIKIDYDRCRGCRLCTEICPFGGPLMDFKERKIIACDLCEGDPTCVKLCSGDALEYVEEEEVPPAARERMMGIYMKALEYYRAGSRE